MAEQNLNQGIELHSKAQALSVAFPFDAQRRRYHRSLSLPLRYSSRVHQRQLVAPPPIAQDPLSLFPTLHLRGVRKQQNYPPSAVALPRGAHSVFLFSAFSLTSIPSPLIPRNPFPTISSTPPLPPLFAVEAAAFRNASTSRGTKGKDWWCKMSPLCQHERAYMSMFFKLQCESSSSVP